MSRITATLKFSKDHDAPWIVVEGETPEQVHDLLARATGLDGEGLNLAQLTQNASTSVMAMRRAGTILGATVVTERDENASQAEATPSAQEPAQGADASTGATGTDENEGILALLAKVPDDKAQLTRFYEVHTADFKSDKSLMDALQARFKKAA